MNSPAINISAPSPMPALELIALAQLSPEVARRKLRALLLTNPNYFAKIPTSSFGAVLNIQQDTTYESIYCLTYDPETEEFSAAIDVKQPTGYSSEIMVRGSEEFIRFYLTYDGGAKWHDLGMRSVTVSDSPRRREIPDYQVKLHIPSGLEPVRDTVQPKIRAILSWSTPPPAGEAGWKPIWGHIAEIDLPLQDSEAIHKKRTLASGLDLLDLASDMMYAYPPMNFASARTHGHLSMRALHSTRTDPHHRFLAFVLARASNCCPDSRTGEHRQVQSTIPPATTYVSVGAGTL